MPTAGQNKALAKETYRMVCLIMSEANRRKKDPEQVRQSLLTCAMTLIGKDGLNNLSVQKVATMAGVTKGGLFHHFPTKQALVDALIDDMLKEMDADIDGMMSVDTEFGAFTRAYIQSMISGFEEDRELFPACLSMMMDPDLCRKWSQWLSQRLDQHKDTDGGAWLETIRYAADGFWLTAMTTPKSQSEVLEVCDRLISATRKELKI